jgi:acetylornithine deacetylase/succinyl-diaminopimelate desuccinylase-like protein
MRLRRPPPEKRIDLHALARRTAVADARRILYETDDETLADQLELVRIPAPPFGEAERADRVRARLEEAGLADVVIDDAGNVLGRLPGPGEAPPILVSAHLDTVFPVETDLTVRRAGERILAPGIADNARGLAALIALARALVRAGVEARHPIVFAATVGEEGVGDLRGVKHLFREGSPWRGAAAFLSLDGTGRRRIVHQAIGSRRLRATVRGQGGHSWADWGMANPIHALGIATAELARYVPPRRPRTTLTVGRTGGGTSVNVIPSEAWIELDLRSEAPRALADLEARTRHALEGAVDEVNRHRRLGTPPLELEVEVIGDRPSGMTPPDSAIVAAARAATRLIGEIPELAASSTDANVPIALGIPAIAMGAGGISGGTHTAQEWYVNEGGPEGLERALLTTLALAEPA